MLGFGFTQERRVLFMLPKRLDLKRLRLRFLAQQDPPSRGKYLGTRDFGISAMRDLVAQSHNGSVMGKFWEVLRTWRALATPPAKMERKGPVLTTQYLISLPSMSEVSPISRHDCGA